MDSSFILSIIISSLFSSYKQTQKKSHVRDWFPKDVVDLSNSHFLVFLGGGQIPCLDDVALRLVDIFFVLQVPDADAHAVLCEDDVLLAHALGRALADLGE